MTGFATLAIRRELGKHIVLDKDNEGNQKAEWNTLVEILHRYLSHEFFRISHN